MSQPSLHEQVVQLSTQLRKRSEGLPLNDPVKDWLLIELAGVEVTSHDEELNLPEANARLRALKQLGHLIFEHCVRLQNPDCELPLGEQPDSLLTVEARIPANVLDSARRLRFSIEPSLLHIPPSDNENFDPVSPTAKVVGFLRSLDRSLKVAPELSQETEGESLLRELGITDREAQASMAVLFQSRFHAMNAAMAHSREHSAQVIEFASGISPRGLQWSNLRPGTIYVESDLPQLMIHKSKLVRNVLLKDRPESRGVLHCCAIDVLNLDSIKDAIHSLDTRRPFTLVTEGLLLYFSQSEMETFWTNMAFLLKTYPNVVWVSDLVSKQNLKDLLNSHPGVAAGVKKTFSLTGREVIPSNPFETESCIEQWIESYGLRVESTVPLKRATSMLQYDVDIPMELRHEIVGSRKIWRISAATI